MSTLATNKIGTLAGTADISLPTTRPSSTLNANLNSAGNLTFAADTSTVEFFAAEDDSKMKSQWKHATAILRVMALFKHHGYKVGMELKEKDDECEEARADMARFIEEFKFLDWEVLSWKMDDKGNKERRQLSVREKARLFQLHHKLYGAV